MTTIIKAEDARSQSSGQPIQHIAFNFGDMADQADKYLDEIRARAARLIQEAEEKAEVIRRQAAKEGQAAGLKEVETMVDQRVAERMETLWPALRQSVEEIQHAKQAWMNHWQERTVQLATAVAQRIVRREIAQCPEITIELVREALELAAGSADVALHLNPDDYKALGKQVEALAAEVAQLAPTRVVPDPHVTPGGCRIETKFGSIDAQLEAQLARIAEELV